MYVFAEPSMCERALEEWEERTEDSTPAFYDHKPRCDGRYYSRVQCAYLGCFCANRKTGNKDNKFGDFTFPEGEFDCKSEFEC